MTKNTCTIKLLNHTFEIKCPEGEEENLHRASEKLAQLTQDYKSQFKHLDPFQVLLLSALNVSHELIMSQKEQEKQRKQVNEFISSLENKIHQTMDGETQKFTDPVL